jgi:hypothetical protein
MARQMLGSPSLNENSFSLSEASYSPVQSPMASGNTDAFADGNALAVQCSRAVDT